ncbi:putative deacetylase LmbE-like domain-containing protein [Gigaspora rosea]|uniref:N-acetylglucosaminylphosphatidylinositol deacetylase n=1 Tax=Gigaspora rosea TaxID=44941 RepID=A0A397U820_9GLOM|nr:putative deacetylase LmbE-like domain-containing protein [Gigaspora rosea]
MSFVFILSTCFFLIFLNTLFIYYIIITSKKYVINTITGLNVLLVISHPDDECMFFSPTLLELGKVEYKNKMHVLCLSVGNESGLGKIRKKELEASCTSLGIDVKFVKCLNHPELQDGPKNVWNPELISSTIEEYIEKHGIDVIITFDDKGISGHPNHSAAYNGARNYILSKIPSKSKSSKSKLLRLYKLKTVNIIRKYISIFDLLQTYLIHNYINIKSLFSESPSFEKDLHDKNKRKNQELVEKEDKLLNLPDSFLFVSTLPQYIRSRTSMTYHKSQLVWFRYLYILASRYMVINQLEMVEK